MSEAIKLNFINRSNDTNNSSVVIFQKNVAQDFCDSAIAWKVIKHCGRLDNHPFLLSPNLQVRALDSYGNYTPHLPASAGQAFQMVMDSSGDVLQLASTPASSSEMIEIRNRLWRGAIDGHLFRDGKLCASLDSIAPGQLGSFELKPVLWIGVMNDVAEGQVLSGETLSRVTTELSLFEITSADIVMTGGGPGEKSTPFEFRLENITG